MLLASLSFAFMGGFAKIVSRHLTGVEVTFFRKYFWSLNNWTIYIYFPLKQKGGRTFLVLL